MLYDAHQTLSAQVFLQLLALLYLRLERERGKRPPAKLGELGEGFDPGETEGVKLSSRSAFDAATFAWKKDVPWQTRPP